MVEGAALEKRYTLSGIAGSNPALSAISSQKASPEVHSPSQPSGNADLNLSGLAAGRHLLHIGIVGKVAVYDGAHPVIIHGVEVRLRGAKALDLHYLKFGEDRPYSFLSAVDSVIASQLCHIWAFCSSKMWSDFGRT